MIAISKPLERLALILVIMICFCASWGTYRLFMPGVTLVTAPVFFLAATFPLALIAYGKKINLTYIDALPAVLLVGVCASYLWALYPNAWPLQAFWYAVCAAAYYAVRIYIIRRRMVELVISASLIGCVIGMFMINEIVSEWGVVDARKAIKGVNQNFTSYVFAGTIYLVIIFESLFLRTKIVKIAAWLACAALAFAIAQLGTRGASLSVGFMAVWIFYSKVFGTRIAPALFIASGIMSLLFTFGIGETFLAAVEGLFGRNTGDLSGRLPTWHSARHLIEENLFTGVGAGAFQFINPMEIGAHNLFLVMLLDTGLLGFLIFVAFLVGGLWPALQPTARPQQRFMVGLFTAYFFPIAVSGHVELSPFTWVLLALTFTLLRPKPGGARG